MLLKLKCFLSGASVFTVTCVSLQFRDLSVPAEERLAKLLKHLHRRGEEACDEFYRALHIHAEDVYTALPSRVTRRGSSTESRGSDLFGPGLNAQVCSTWRV